MKDVAQLEVQQHRIFPPDKLPFVPLVTQLMAEAFAKRLGGAAFAPGQTGEMRFVGGNLLADDGKRAFVIKVVELRDRKLSIVVQGASAAANQAYALIAAFMSELGHAPGDPLILTEETSCVASLGFDWTALVDRRLSTFVLGEFADTIKDAFPTSPQLRGLSLSFRLAFPSVPEALAQTGISLSEKTLTVEPRQGTALSERRYFTTSPTDSGTHLALLQKLEAVLGGQQAQLTGATPRRRSRRS